VDLVVGCYRHGGQFALAFSDSEQCYCLIQRQICCSFNPLLAVVYLGAAQRGRSSSELLLHLAAFCRMVQRGPVNPWLVAPDTGRDWTLIG
jgi:hypothetical protein